MPEPDPLLVALGAAIRRRRTRLRLSQHALAGRAGLSQKRVHELEHAQRGDVQLVSTVKPLADALGLDVVELLVAARVEARDLAAGEAKP